MEFIVSSRNATSGNSSNFTIATNFPNRTFTQIKLMDAAIPMTFNNTSGSITITGTNSGASIITITPDKYTVPTLLSYIQTAITSVKVGQVYAVSATATGLFTFTSSTELFSITFAPTNAAQFGFASGTTSTADSQTSAFSAFSALQVDAFICICSSAIWGIDNGTVIMEQNQVQNHVIAAVPTCCSGTVQYRNPGYAPPALLIKNVLPTNFYITFTNGTPVNLNGADWSAKFLLS